MTDLAYSTTASRALAIPEILEAVLEHAYAVSKDIREFAMFKFVNRLWLQYTEALQVATVYIDEANDVIAHLPHSQITLLGVTPLLERRPELYHRIRELQVYGTLKRKRPKTVVTASLALGLRAAATSAHLRALYLSWRILDYWQTWQDHLSPLAINLECLEMQFSNRVYKPDECVAVCDLIRRAANLRHLRLGYGHNISRNNFSKVLASAVGSLDSLHLGLHSVKLPIDILHEMLVESGLHTRQIRSLRLGLCPDENASINALLPNSLRRIALGSTYTTIKYFLRALADPAFLPSLEWTPSFFAVMSWRGRIHITRSDIEQAIASLKKRKRIIDLEREGDKLFDLVQELDEEVEHKSEESEESDW